MEHAVVIAGGGPTGLMLAGELALAGVDVAIVERRATQDLAGARSIHILIGAWFDDDDVDARQRQLARQHQPGRAASRDHHRMLGHPRLPLFSVGSGLGRRVCGMPPVLPQAPSCGIH